jgi:hypothetical protein
MKRAVQHALLIIAEAAKHIPADLKDMHPEDAVAKDSWPRQYATPRVPAD